MFFVHNRVLFVVLNCEFDLTKNNTLIRSVKHFFMIYLIIY